MRFVKEFRDKKVMKDVLTLLNQEVDPNKSYQFMEFCGGHTHALFRHGINDVLPKNITMVHGPGCPVCVMPMSRIDLAIHLAGREDTILCTYGDMMRVPGSNKVSLITAKAMGAQVEMVYSSLEALTIAQQNPDKQVVFYAIGFETTTPPTAVAIKKAAEMNLPNFTVFCNHVVTPAAIQRILNAPEIRQYEPVKLDGFLGPSHVSTIIGTEPYEYFAEEFKKPVVVAGFEPLDMLQSILMLVKQVNKKEAKVENQYIRAVSKEGNLKAQQLVSDTFELRKSFEWRGLGQIPYSALQIKEEFAHFDTEKRWKLPEMKSAENKACLCGSILRGVKKPIECKLFGTACTPETPMGSCMVSSEGACSAYYTYQSQISPQSS